MKVPYYDSFFNENSFLLLKDEEILEKMLLTTISGWLKSKPQSLIIQWDLLDCITDFSLLENKLIIASKEGIYTNDLIGGMVKITELKKEIEKLEKEKHKDIKELETEIDNLEHEVQTLKGEIENLDDGIKELEAEEGTSFKLVLKQRNKSLQDLDKLELLSEVFDKYSYLELRDLLTKTNNNG